MSDEDAEGEDEERVGVMDSDAIRGIVPNEIEEGEDTQ